MKRKYKGIRCQRTKLQLPKRRWLTLDKKHQTTASGLCTGHCRLRAHLYKSKAAKLTSAHARSTHCSRAASLVTWERRPCPEKRERKRSCGERAITSYWPLDLWNHWKLRGHDNSAHTSISASSKQSKHKIKLWQDMDSPYWIIQQMKALIIKVEQTPEEHAYI